MAESTKSSFLTKRPHSGLEETDLMSRNMRGDGSQNPPNQESEEHKSGENENTHKQEVLKAQQDAHRLMLL